MLGAPEVGKSSLVRRFVHSIFSDVYTSTIGVIIERVTVQLQSGDELTMILWDIHGESLPLVVPDRYLRGLSGFLVVIDASRPDTLTAAIDLKERVFGEVGPVPHVVVWNKADLVEGEDVATSVEARALAEGASVALFTSAKTGESVESAFTALAEAIAAESA